MSYIDGFVLAVPHAKKEEYRRMAAKVAGLFREFGALDVAENWGDNVPHGKTTDFYMATKAKEDENVLFSWITWPSKEVRDAAWEKMMADDRMKPDGDMPFDGQRMFWGGFEPLDLTMEMEAA